MSPRTTGLIAVLLATLAVPAAMASDASQEWALINGNANWAPRSGLQVVQLKNRFYLMGGRSPLESAIPGDSFIWGDVWRSDDRGRTWRQILDTDTVGHWPARAFFQAVSKGKHMYVFGGQNFLLVPNECPPGVPECPPFVSSSDFFSDVWRSRDGVHWVKMTDDAGWEPRAGLSSAVLNGEIYVIGGSQNDDSAIIGPFGPERIYFNDVWKSRDGIHWQQMTDNAPWEPRAGAAVTVKDGYIYLLGGEDGFVCEPLPFCEPPYFNDVWRSRDGATWELVTPAADWVARPGHQCVVVHDHIVCFGGFGLITNPMDVWASRNGKKWKQISDSPWNAVSPDQIKYDFKALSTRTGRHGKRQSIFTFGGSRETFDFGDPENIFRIDNDVWRFSPDLKRQQE